MLYLLCRAQIYICMYIQSPDLHMYVYTQQVKQRWGLHGWGKDNKRKEHGGKGALWWISNSAFPSWQCSVHVGQFDRDRPALQILSISKWQTMRFLAILKLSGQAHPSSLRVLWHFSTYHGAVAKVSRNWDKWKKLFLSDSLTSQRGKPHQEEHLLPPLGDFCANESVQVKASFPQGSFPFTQVPMCKTHHNLVRLRCVDKSTLAPPQKTHLVVTQKMWTHLVTRVQNPGKWKP